MTEPPPTAPPSDSPQSDLEEQAQTPWHPLPARARPVHVAGELPGIAVLTGLLGGASFAIGLLLEGPGTGVTLASAVGLVILGFGLWISLRRFKRMRWRLDALGLALRSGSLWQHETQVPITRVQHLDLTRGPLQQARSLATLVVYTAGSKHSAVSIPNLDAKDAEHLRDRLGHQIDQDAS